MYYRPYWLILCVYDGNFMSGKIMTLKTTRTSTRNRGWLLESYTHASTKMFYECKFALMVIKIFDLSFGLKLYISHLFFRWFVSYLELTSTLLSFFYCLRCDKVIYVFWIRINISFLRCCALKIKIHLCDC